jgi:hypothetical protein
MTKHNLARMGGGATGGGGGGNAAGDDSEHYMCARGGCEKAGIKRCGECQEVCNTQFTVVVHCFNAVKLKRAYSFAWDLAAHWPVVACLAICPFSLAAWYAFHHMDLPSTARSSNGPTHTSRHITPHARMFTHFC